MSEHIQIVFQSPINPLADESSAISRIAGDIDCFGVELAGAVDEFLSLINSQVPLAGLQLGALGSTLRVVAWDVTGFVAGQDANDGVCPLESALTSLLTVANQTGIERISFAPADFLHSRGKVESYASALNRTAAALVKVMPHAERNGLALCIRPARGRFLTSPVELRELVTGINSPMLGIDLPIHLPDGVPDWTDWFEPLEPFIRSVRVMVDGAISRSQIGTVLDELQRTIAGICKPRSYDGLIALCPCPIGDGGSRTQLEELKGG
jgi:hypothetical protein